MSSKRVRQARQKRQPVAKKPMKRVRPTARRAPTGMDSGGLAYARLLSDPCNSPMVSPVYSGMGTGEFRRFRTVFNIPNSTEGTFAFVPGSNLYFAATHVESNAGNPYTFGTYKLFDNPQLTDTVESRCVAACVKIRFIGAESNRKGTIALRTNPFNWVRDGITVTNNNMLTACPVINRVGEVLHEVKFVPGTADEIFTGNYGGPIVAGNALGSFGFVYSDIPTGSLQVEVTAVIEIEAEANMVVSSVAPSSRNTTNNVLSALGPPARWAFGHVVAPTIRAAAGAAMQTISSGVNSSSVGGLLLTL